ncbi:MAG TPA: putative lipid II flippase FtsW [Acidimicrobiia bacterium]|jgi:cell division protein FtsW|nr:putative lipid II flippase FtsW [Acidimicrobiia bacterium]
MTANVTSLAKVRAAARDKIALQKVNDRATTTLLVLVVVLVVIGLGVTMSASSAVALNQTETQDQWHFLKRQLVGVGLGTVALLVMSRIPYRFYRKLAIPAFLGTVGLLLLVEFKGLTEGGATRWVNLPGLPSFQPSELAKLGVILVLSYLLEKKARLLTRFWHFIIPVVATVGVVGVLVIRQPDLGTLLIIGAAAMAVIVASDAPMKYVLLLGLLAVAAATYLAFDADYRASRIDSYLDPYADPTGDGYQLLQGYYALGNGGIFGVGLGASRARWFYLPNAHTDFIFAIIGEETGLLGGLTVIGLFIALAVAGWVVAARAPDRFGRMVAAGITVWLSFQALVNIGGVLGVVPITGIALPFVSFGSTALIVSMGAVGILVNIAQSGVDRPR